MRPANTLLIILLALVGFLRFYDLGYSDYVKDEHRTFYDARYRGTFWEFALDQRKGPMQYLVAFIPKFVVGNFSNEFAQRLPFACFNMASVYVFYLVVSKLTGDKRVGITAAGLYAFNGFITAFGRIAQYQNINLLFSLVAIYFYHNMVYKETNKVISAVFGTLALVVSSLAHWDAIFIAVPVVYIWFLLFRDPSASLKTKLVSAFVSLSIFLLLVLPFLVPYIHNQFNNTGNKSYLERRVGFNKGRDLEFDFLIKLYNPFLSYYFYIVLGVIGALFIRKSALFIAWFVVNFLLFYFFAAKPGTHVYNFLIPVFALCAVGFWQIFDHISKINHRQLQNLKYILLVTLTVVLAFMFYQSYRLFVESKDEYPWEDEKILFLTAKRYQGKKVLPLFGFPHYRAWDQIGKLIAQENSKNGTSYTYDTNEDNAHISFYTGVGKSNSESGYFYIGVKRPISFVNDWKPKQIKNKTRIKEFSTNGEVVSILYIVKPKD